MLAEDVDEGAARGEAEQGFAEFDGEGGFPAGEAAVGPTAADDEACAREAFVLIGEERGFDGWGVAQAAGEDDGVIDGHVGALAEVGRGGMGGIAEENDAVFGVDIGGGAIDEIVLEDGLIGGGADGVGQSEGEMAEAVEEPGFSLG